MASSVFSPLNSYALSDQVIGGVVQRVGPLHSCLGLTDETESREVARYTKPRQTFPLGHSNAYSSSTLSTTEELPPRSAIGRKRLPDLDSLADLASTRTSNSLMEQEDTPAFVTGHKMRVSASRRERCRINQTRYRKSTRTTWTKVSASYKKKLKTWRRGVITSCALLRQMRACGWWRLSTSDSFATNTWRL